MTDQETLLPSLQKESGRKTETVMVPFEKAAQKVPLKSSYAKWLNQAYPGYASGWLLYQSALACENNFEGSQARSVFRMKHTAVL